MFRVPESGQVTHLPTCGSRRSLLCKRLDAHGTTRTRSFRAARTSSVPVLSAVSRTWSICKHNYLEFQGESVFVYLRPAKLPAHDFSLSAIVCFRAYTSC